MKWLVNYFRQCFCKHDWLIEEIPMTADKTHYTYSSFDIKEFVILPDYYKWTRIYMRCSKCALHQSHDKE